MLGLSLVKHHPSLPSCKSSSFVRTYHLTFQKNQPWLNNPCCFCAPFHSQPWMWENTEDSLLACYLKACAKAKLYQPPTQVFSIQFSSSDQSSFLKGWRKPEHSHCLFGVLSQPHPHPTSFQTLPTPRTFHKMNS